MTPSEKLKWLNSNNYLGRSDWSYITWPTFTNQHGVYVYTIDGRPMIVNNDYFTPWQNNFLHPTLERSDRESS